MPKLLLFLIDTPVLDEPVDGRVVRCNFVFGYRVSSNCFLHHRYCTLWTNDWNRCISIVALGLTGFAQVCDISLHLSSLEYL